MSMSMSLHTSWRTMRPSRGSCSTLRHQLKHAGFNPRYSITTTTAATITSSSSPSSSSSVDVSEISHFDGLAATWWDIHGSSRLLHLMNPLRHDFIRSCLSSTYNPYPHGGIRYLDVGCGGGIFSESAARLADTEKVVGIDPSKEGIAVARRHARLDPLFQQPVVYTPIKTTAINTHNNNNKMDHGDGNEDKHGKEPRLSYTQTSIESLPRPKSVQEQYDVLTLFEVLEHVTEPARFLEQCLPFVKPGGWLVLSTIARTWTSWLTTKFVAEEVAGLVPRGTHDWAKYINEHELRDWFAQRPGWTRVRAMGVVYVPGLGWTEVRNAERWGNYFFGVRRDVEVR